MLPFNVPAYLGTELEYVQQAIAGGHLSGNGSFTKRVHAIFEQEFGYHKVFLTHSCTGALEMAALLLDLQPGDEVVLPSFTHVGTANAFERAGATLRFADSMPGHPNIDLQDVARLIGPRTRALVVVHYAGVLCDMDALSALCTQHGISLIEDAAHAIGATYQGKSAGSFGRMAAFSFHETKNLQCGQGGLLILNDPQDQARASILWENGTNRAAFFTGLVDQYTWVDTGACFSASELSAAYLYGQLEGRAAIQGKRMALWTHYHTALRDLAEEGHFELPWIDARGQHNAHIFYLSLPDRSRRDALMAHLRAQGFLAVFHYVPLHDSPHFRLRHPGGALLNCQGHSDRILRLPLFYALDAAGQEGVIEAVRGYY